MRCQVRPELGVVTGWGPARPPAHGCRVPRSPTLPGQRRAGTVWMPASLERLKSKARPCPSVPRLAASQVRTAGPSHARDDAARGRGESGQRGLQVTRRGKKGRSRRACGEYRSARRGAHPAVCNSTDRPAGVGQVKSVRRKTNTVILVTCRVQRTEQANEHDESLRYKEETGGRERGRGGGRGGQRG